MIRDEHGQTCEALDRPPRLLGPLQERALVKKALSAGVDLVHLNYLRPEQGAWLRSGAPPFIATAWGSDVNEHDFPRPPAYRARIDRILRGAAAVTGDSVPMVQRLQNRLGDAPRHPVELVMWGVDTALFARDRHQARAAELKAELGIEPGDLVLLSPRQNIANYHTDRIVRAFANSAWPRHGVLVIKLHGRAVEAENKARLTALATELGVLERVRFAPKTSYDDLPAIYAMADAAVSALEADGVPSTFCELIALGVPILATDLDSYEGVLDEGRGVLVPPGDVVAMAAGMDRLCEDPALRAALAQKGRDHALSALSWRVSVDRWLALYERALASS